MRSEVSRPDQDRTMDMEARNPSRAECHECRSSIFNLRGVDSARSSLTFQLLERVSFFLTSYLVPLVLICGLYLGMLLRLWHGVAPGGHVSAESRRGKKRVTRMVVVVVVIFAVCWCPIQVILVLKTLDQYEITNTTVMLQIASHVLAYMNSCVNPILYAFLSDNFRKAFRKVIACGPVSGARGSGTRYHRASVNQANGRVDADNKTCNTKTTRTNGSSNDIL